MNKNEEYTEEELLKISQKEMISFLSRPTLSSVFIQMEAERLELENLIKKFKESHV